MKINSVAIVPLFAIAFGAIFALTLSHSSGEIEAVPAPGSSARSSRYDHASKLARTRSKRLIEPLSPLAQRPIDTYPKALDANVFFPILSQNLQTRHQGSIEKPTGKHDRVGGGSEGGQVEGPEIVRDRVEDYLRRHGMDQTGFDSNERLRRVRDEYQRMEIEKADAAARPQIPGTNWISLGPTNGAGRLASIAVHPTLAGTIFAGAAGGGLWKSPDGGVSWTPLTESINDLFVGAVAIAPSSPNIIYLGTGEGNTGTPGIGVLKSIDGGNNWQFPSTVLARNFYKILVHPTNPQEVIVGADRGGYRSSDGGQTWATVIANNAPVTDIIRHPSNPSTLYATTRAPTQILKSTDGGISWASKSSGIPVGLLDRLAIALSPSSPLVMYVASASQDAVAHIYKTTNGGESWSELLGVSTNSSPSIRQYFADYNQNAYDNALVVSPSDPNIVIAGGVTYIKSTDGGATWTVAFGGGGYPHPDAHDMQYQGSTLYVANDGGVWSSSDNGQTGTDRNAGLVTRQFYTVADDPINRARIYGGTQDNGTNRRLQPNPSAWTEPMGADGFDCAVNPYEPETFYGTVQSGRIFRTRTAGSAEFFQEEITPPYASGEFRAFATVLAMDPNNPSVLYTGSNQVWKSADGGTTWAKLPTTRTDGSVWPSGAVSKIAVAKSDSRVLVVQVLTELFRSNNGGQAWSRVTPPIFANNLEFDPQDANVIYAATPAGVYITTNGGLSWTTLGNGLPSFSSHVVRVDPTDPNTLFCGTDVGIYKSTDKGLNWSKFGAGLPSASVYDIRIMKDGSALRAATHGRGMWELQIPSNGNNPPSASITGSPSAIVATGVATMFSGSVSDPDVGDPVTGFWYFSDNGEITPASTGNIVANHTFTKTGTFTATLVARDSHGALGQELKTINVFDISTLR